MHSGPGCFVLGAGGHAKVVVATLQDAGIAITGILDDNQDLHGRTLLGAQILGGLQAQPSGAPAIVAIGNNRLRSLVVGRHQAHWISVVHPTAYVHPTARLEPGAIVCARAVIQPDVLIGRHAIVNTGASVDHDSVVGDFAHLGPGANLAGAVEVGEGALMGVGSAAAPGARVGAWSILGAGAVVLDEVPPDSTAVGVPARPLLRGRTR